MGVHLLPIALVATVALSAGTLGMQPDGAERRAASPTLGERINQDSVTGRIQDIGARYVSIKGEQVKRPVSASTIIPRWIT